MLNRSKRRGLASCLADRRRLLYAASAVACLVLGCAEPMPPEHVAAITKFQGLGGRVVFHNGGYRLNMADSRVQDADLVFLKDIRDLKVLDLRGTQITDEGMEKLVTLKSLQSVMLTSSRVSPEGVEKLQQARPELTVTR
jgi:hypothetical protein